MSSLKKSELIMDRSKIKKIVFALDHEIDSITDECIRSIQKSLLNLVEYLIAENDSLQEENQRLRDENNRLKGEQGKPSIRDPRCSNH